MAIASPVVRNLEITHCYGRLSAAMEQRTGRCANWCTFATWASRQAGRTIRGEDLIETLRTRLHQGPGFLHPLASLGRVVLRRGLFDPQTRLGRLTAQLHTPFDVFERTSDAVGRGNRKVFEEIGLEFARYLHEVPCDADVDSPQLRAFLDRLRAGEPPDGQRYLRQAFARYARAAATTDERARAQLLLLANLEVAMHEQTRLQPRSASRSTRPTTSSRTSVAACCSCSRRGGAARCRACSPGSQARSARERSAAWPTCCARSSRGRSW